MGVSQFSSISRWDFPQKNHPLLGTPNAKPSVAGRADMNLEAPEADARASVDGHEPREVLSKAWGGSTKSMAYFMENPNLK